MALLVSLSLIDSIKPGFTAHVRFSLLLSHVFPPKRVLVVVHDKLQLPCLYFLLDRLFPIIREQWFRCEDQLIKRATVGEVLNSEG